MNPRRCPSLASTITRLDVRMHDPLNIHPTPTVPEGATLAPEVGVISRERLAAARVLVVGDAMLDRYWFGDVDRISPEAPVPVVKIARSEERPGGAANVARNAAALGAQVTLISVIGDDEPGHVLERLLRGESVHTSLHRDP